MTDQIPDSEYDPYNEKRNKEAIDALLPELLSLDRSSSGFKRAEMELVGCCYGYLCAINCRNQEFGYEILKTVQTCIKNYDASRGEFLAYLVSSWNKGMSPAKIDSRANENYRYGGIRGIPRKRIRKLEKLQYYVRAKYPGLSGEEVLAKIADAEDIPVSELRELAKAGISRAEPEQTDSEGGSFFLPGILAGPENIERQFADEIQLDDLLSRIDLVFSSVQARQKPLISSVLTAEICREDPGWVRRIAQYSFADSDLLREYRESGRLPTRKELCRKYGKKESSLSRSLSRFREKFRKTEDGDG